ncbi:ToxD-like protein [Parachaetomium inaequale]|uniref:ToxD-like protein n=1 Tax=Parachaetomium inaequale TaxID=2588326 RepID=A0AAN6SQY0_9PEZI|nr:ToxD-like protein [Parachaetomium inaequale]
MKALLLNTPLTTASLCLTTPLPTPQHHTDLLIRVEAVALNPVDALYTSHPLGATGRTVGSDFAGMVVQGTEPIYGAVWEGLGVEIQYQGFVVPASAEARRFAATFYKWLSKGGKLEANPIRLMPGGLDRVVDDGFVLLGSGTMEARQRDRTEEWMRPISAEKLVYRVRG